MRAQSATAGSRAAAFGGTTTFIDFALQRDDGSLLAAIQAKRDELRKDRPHIDYALHAMITGRSTFEVLEEIKDAVAAGVISFKMFTTFSGQSVGGLFLDDGRVWGVMEQLARHGGVAMLHCEDDCIIDFSVRRLYREGRQKGTNIHIARPNLCEEAALRRMLLLAQRSGSPLYVVHVSTHEGVEAIEEAQGKGQVVYGEALHNYLAFTSDDYLRPNGLAYHNYPALKSALDRDTLWAGLRSRALDIVSSDDFTIPLAAKLSGQHVDNVLGGHNGIETRMPVLFSEGVSKGRLSINRFVEVTASAPARVFGIYPQKGAIAPGSDADIVLIDAKARHTIRQAKLHSECDYSLWDGWECQGVLRMTIARGQVLVEDGRWVGTVRAGEFVPGLITRSV
jgi:dihydropyrimidinase